MIVFNKNEKECSGISVGILIYIKCICFIHGLILNSTFPFAIQAFICLHIFSNGIRLSEANSDKMPGGEIHVFYSWKNV